MKNKYRLVLILILLTPLLAAIFEISRFSNRKTVRAKVLDKERITKSSGDQIHSYYLIFTDSGTFKLADEILYGNFNSSDLYGTILRDSSYTFTLIGFRIGFVSEYPNIVGVK